MYQLCMLPILTFIFSITYGSIAAHAALPKLQVVTSLSCPHCNEHADDIQQTIDTAIHDGMIDADVEWIDYPTDLATLVATKLTWSKGPHERKKLYRHFLKHQNIWHNKDWRTHLPKIAHDVGLSQETIDECCNTKDDSPTKDIENTIIDRLNNVLNRHGLQFVPAFILNETMLLKGLTQKDLYEAAQTIHDQTKQHDPSHTAPRIIEK